MKVKGHSHHPTNDIADALVDLTYAPDGSLLVAVMEIEVVWP